MPRGIRSLVPVLVVFSLVLPPNPVLADACDEGILATDPVFSIATRHASDRRRMAIDIVNAFAGVRALVVQVSGEEETYDQLLVVAESVADREELGEMIQSLAAREVLSFSAEELPAALSHVFEAPRDDSARMSVRLFFSDGSQRTYQLCEAGSSAKLTVRQRKSVAAAPAVAANERCYCVRLECSGSTNCHIEKECCGFLGACTCCACGPGGTCVIVCPPCDLMP